ncbi:hypothetical protein J3R30DRAFT_3402396 [Lentinula aciculospora]|uniref:NADP-dependent oxidoreductase domain-containing protein n=1 Tax=Lentinula aciculospora TaxID=153920 RepID=A0A9W9AJ14_9AGAR|nr:hypothetical protein J3R30DRAFT_3402396 [Lentinula aciculospora]
MRESLVATRADPDANPHGLSHKRLQIDYADVLQYQKPFQAIISIHTPIAEVTQASHDVVQAGYMRYIFLLMRDDPRGLLTDLWVCRLHEALLIGIEQIATKKNISMAQVAVAWNLAKEERISGGTAPMVGTTSFRNLEDMIEVIGHMWIIRRLLPIEMKLQ